MNLLLSQKYQQWLNESKTSEIKQNKKISSKLGV